jgi:calcineurin-like phosphoesterase family protein
MKKLSLTLFLITLLIQIQALKTTSAPFINLDKDSFLLYYPIIENDSLITMEKKIIMQKDDFEIKFQNCKFSVPVYKETIPPVDSINTKAPVFCVSDIEGNFQAFYDLLLNNGIIDNKCNWIFGNGQLVIVGDMVDRGEYVNECLYLLYKLDFQAFNKGGRVHYLLGNHDIMLLSGDHRYVHQKYKYISASFNTSVLDLYSDKTLLGHWMRSKNTLLKLNDLLFVHAGISPELIKNNYTIPEINTSVSNYLKSNQADDRTSFILKSKGPFWYRGLVSDYKNESKLNESDLDLILSYFQVNKIIIGHTIVDNISPDYHDKVIRIDVFHIETPQALKILKGVFFKANTSGKLTKL